MMTEAHSPTNLKENTATHPPISQNTAAPTHLTIEELLSRDGKIVYKAKGRSMLPMLRHDHDLVLIEAVNSSSAPPARYDVVLYKV